MADALAMKPVGYHDPAVFTDLVMRFSPPCEPFDLSVRRLWRCVKQDADALGVRAELSPARVAYAYRHHFALRQPLDAKMTRDADLFRIADLLETQNCARAARRYLEKVIRRATRRKQKESKMENAE